MLSPSTFSVLRLISSKGVINYTNMTNKDGKKNSSRMFKERSMDVHTPRMPIQFKRQDEFEHLLWWLLPSHLYLDVAIGLQHGFESTLSVFGRSGSLRVLDGSEEFSITHGHLEGIKVFFSIKLSEETTVKSGAIVIAGGWDDSSSVSLVLLALLAVLVVSTVSVSVSVVISVVWSSVAVVTMSVGVATVVVRLRSIVSTCESIWSTRKKDFVDNVNDTVARDDILTEGFLVSSGSFILVDIEDKVVLRGEFISSENVVWNSNGGLEAVHHVTRSKLLSASSGDTSGLRSLSVSGTLVGVDGSVGLSTSEVLSQSSRWKKVKFQESLTVDSRNDTVNLGKGSVGRSENGVGRVTGGHKGLDIRVVINEVTEHSEVVTDTGIDVGIGTSGGSSIEGTGAKVTI